MSILHQLIKESTNSVANSQGRPQLLSLTRAVNSLIFTDLVAIQPTNQPISAFYGLRYLNQDGNMTFRTPATYGGSVGNRADIKEVDLDHEYKAGDLFKDGDTVYSVIEAGSLGSDKDKQASIFRAIMLNKIRFYSDCASTSHFEDSKTTISDSQFMFDKWQVEVGSRKLKTSYTVELLQDLEANQINADGAIYDLLATTSSEEINKDIIQKLITVSSRYNVNGVTNGGILSLAGVQDAPAQARELYRFACEMSAHLLRTTSFRGTYVLASSRVVGLLNSSGWMQESKNPLSEGRLRCGLEVYADVVSPFDYMLVGCKHNVGEMESVGSLFYAPYTESDGAGAYKGVIDPNSFQNHLCIMNRYALSVNPYTTSVDQEKNKVIKGDDWNKLAGRSEMSCMIGVELPKIESK